MQPGLIAVRQDVDRPRLAELRQSLGDLFQSIALRVEYQNLQRARLLQQQLVEQRLVIRHAGVDHDECRCCGLLGISCV